jgi:D-alanyl-D-alanine-carboxypeptidase/D-alanyl-D-alanine-endopeptidase
MAQRMFDRKRGLAVVVLENTMTTAGIDDIGRHLLDPSVPLAVAPAERKEVKVDPKQLDRYVGRYQLAPTFVLSVTRDGDHLFVQATGQPKFDLFAQSDQQFFLKAVDAQITFETDASGRTTTLILQQNGIDQAARRME